MHFNCAEKERERERERALATLMVVCKLRSKKNYRSFANVNIVHGRRTPGMIAIET